MLRSIVSKAALRSRTVRIEIEPESEAVRRSFKTRRRAVSVLCFGDTFDDTFCVLSLVYHVAVQFNSMP